MAAQEGSAGTDVGKCVMGEQEIHIKAVRLDVLRPCIPSGLDSRGLDDQTQ